MTRRTLLQSLAALPMLFVKGRPEAKQHSWTTTYSMERVADGTFKVTKILAVRGDGVSFVIAEAC